MDNSLICTIDSKCQSRRGIWKESIYFPDISSTIPKLRPGHWRMSLVVPSKVVVL